MKNFILIFIILTITSCSFDNKTGIWRDASNIPLEKNTTKSINDNKSKNRYESIFFENEKYNEEKISLNNSILNIDAPITTKDWTQQYGSKTNNISNYSYTGFNTIVSKSPKLNKNSENKNIVFFNKYSFNDALL